MKKLFYLCICALFVFTGCKQTTSNEVEVVNLADVIEVGDLTQIATDFVVVPLKSDSPIDGFQRIKCIGSKTFGWNNDGKKIYCFDNYELYAIINRLGRGPGEYTKISDFAYNEKKNILYISNDSIILCYDATTMDYIGKRKVNIFIHSMQVFGDKVIYECSPNFLNDKMYSYVILADDRQDDLSNATLLSRNHFLHESIYGGPQVSCINKMNRSYSKTDYVNSIVTFDDDSITTIYNFRLGDIDIPKSYIDPDYSQYENDQLSFILNWFNYFADSPRPGNISNTIVDGKTISFCYNYYRDNSSYSPDHLYWVHNKNKTKVYHSLHIPGIPINIEPIGCHDNRNVAILDNYGNDCIDDSTEMSPLGIQIIEAMKAQNDDNPVLIEFRFK